MAIPVDLFPVLGVLPQSTVKSYAALDNVCISVSISLLISQSIFRIKQKVNTSRNEYRWLLSPACIAGVLFSFPNLSALCGRR
jgi:hypothetical protein